MAAPPSEPEPQPDDKPPAASEEKKDGEDEEGGDGKADGGGGGGETKPVKIRKKRKFTQSRYFGGEGGVEFNHGNNRHIDEITVYADDDVVSGVSVTYPNKTTKDGKCDANGKTLKLRTNEYITSVKMKLKRINGKRNVTCITFFSNRGTQLGPCGSEEGEDFELSAPNGMVLCGIMGRAGNRLDAIAFRWGTAPEKE